jgi:hypothetical protein
MSMITELTAATQWREKIAELRQVAERVEDTRLQGRLIALADDWDDFADELELAEMRWARH